MFENHFSSANPEMIVVARESRGYSQTAFSEALGIGQGTVSKYESGVLPVPDQVVSEMASLLRYPRSFFFAEDKVFGFNSSVFLHRRRSRVPDKILRAVHAQINVRRFNVRRFLRSVELDSPNAFSRLDIQDFRGRADRVAQMVRGMWRVPPGPIRNVTRLIENAGGVVLKLDFGTSQIDAISEWVPDHPPIFFVNSCSSITGDRLRRTLAHEIGHAFMHFVPNDNMEEQADAFASEFLTPAREIKPSLSKLTLPKLANLKSEWLVSMSSLIERAFELKVITARQRQYLAYLMASQGYKIREPEETDIPIEQPSIISGLIDAHLGPLEYSPAELAGVLNLEPDEFRDIYIESGKITLVSFPNVDTIRSNKRAVVAE
jgi:Zn-dependent peptidase ImmA (M78 family)